MTRNWYAVYTRPQHEKKVASLLSKKGIKNYYPINHVTRQKLSTTRVMREPLFSSFVFVHITEQELALLRKVPGVINLVYWMAKPAIISKEEIDALQQFTSVYQNIRLEKACVNVSGMVKVVDDPLISFKENAATIRFQTLKIVLPCLGYTLIAEREKAKEQSLQLVSRPGLFNKLVNYSFLSN